jgi:hypothetical protein
MIDVPRTINFADRANDTRAARRRWAHTVLDNLLEALEAWQDMPGDDAPPTVPRFMGFRESQARNLFGEVLGFASILSREVREAAAPTYRQETGPDMRAALIEAINMLAPVWPQTAKSHGFNSPQPIWPSDAARWLEMLNSGQIPTIFDRPKGAGSYNWTEARFRLVAVLWAHHLEHAYGEKRENANNRVACAFDPSTKQTALKSGRLPQGQLPRWQTWVDAIANGQDDPSIARNRAQSGLALAKTKPSAEYNLDHNRREIGLGLYYAAFDAMISGAETLEEAGQRFQSHRAQKASEPQTERQRMHRLNRKLRT